jgi:D-alanyl-lipoteichoic acid acyltransferase DltB (MBOAT superfamily)
MLFNSPVFIFGFVPIVMVGFFAVSRLGMRWGLWWLAAASLVFYGWWNPAWVPLLIGSIAFNFTAAKVLAGQAPSGTGPNLARDRSRSILIFAIAANLALLGYYKYSAFVVNSVTALVGADLRLAAKELPLGISFFTFTQIAFLVDVYQKRAAEFDPLRYGLFVTYFPHLIAGPILHHREMMPQFARPDIFRFDPSRLADGLAIFVLGLFKKTVLADQFGIYAGPAFGAAGSHVLTFYEAWSAVLAYTLQIYFDFSGYSDMAIGLAVMIGIELPRNFNSPYKARNIAEFWRRWHMTLSRFLRDYLYIPLGGNRKGRARRYVNLMVTMLLGGLWHGAGWTFVVWGALHGAYLVIHGAWMHIVERSGIRANRFFGAPLGALAWLLTFFAVVVGWVFFRSPTIDAALSMLDGMLGRNGAALPAQVLAFVPKLAPYVTGVGTVPFLADGTVMGLVEMLCMLALGLVIAVAAPNLYQMPRRWRYWLLVPCAALSLQRVLFAGSSEFLYFQF